MNPPPRTPEEVFRAFAPRLYTLARRMLADPAEAEEVTHDVLLQALESPETRGEEAERFAWLRRVAVKAVLERRRQTGPTLDWTGPGGGAEAPPGATAPGESLRGRLERAIAALPVAYRDVFVLIDVEGADRAAAGDLLGLSLKAVQRRLHTARRLLHEAIAPHLEEGAA